jgi:soluble lytic murein transglycosylase-like protein
VIRQSLVLVLLSGSVAQGAEAATAREYATRWTEYYARVYRVPLEFAEAVIEVESDWYPYAVSQKGAVGLMQLMPGTAVKFGVWNRFRAQENVRAGGLSGLAHGFIPR